MCSITLFVDSNLCQQEAFSFFFILYSKMCILSKIHIKHEKGNIIWQVVYQHTGREMVRLYFITIGIIR